MDEGPGRSGRPFDVLTVRLREFWLLFLLAGVVLALLAASQFGKPAFPVVFVVTFALSTAYAVGIHLRGRYLQCDTFIVDKSPDEVRAILMHPLPERRWLGRAWILSQTVAIFLIGVLIGWLLQAIFSFSG